MPKSQLNTTNRKHREKASPEKLPGYPYCCINQAYVDKFIKDGQE
jgi:hypothetical protein